MGTFSGLHAGGVGVAKETRKDWNNQKSFAACGYQEESDRAQPESNCVTRQISEALVTLVGWHRGIGDERSILGSVSFANDSV
jgi:hypothetical protein